MSLPNILPPHPLGSSTVTVDYNRESCKIHSIYEGVLRGNPKTTEEEKTKTETK